MIVSEPKITQYFENGLYVKRYDYEDGSVGFVRTPNYIYEAERKFYEKNKNMYNIK